MATTQNVGKKQGAKASAVPGAGGAPNVPAIDGASLLGHYRQMMIVRLFEEACQRAFRQGKVGGYLHLYIGQEAVAKGFIDSFEPGDRVITAYRHHAHTLFLGAEPRAVMAEIYGKGTGLVKGKGGSMHLFNADRGMMGGYGIVGGHIPLGVGMAYAQAYRKSGNIVQLYLGDGAIHNGAFHEAANLAGLWGRDGLNPCLFILENNQYGMGTSVERATAMTNLGSKFDSYGIGHEKVDGMDLEAVLAVAKRATEMVRQTGKPYAVEAMTYRLSAHGAADFLERYRSKDEVKKWRERDPIGMIEHKLVESGAADDAQIGAIHDEAKAIVDDAVTFAEESSDPDVAELYTDVYAAS